MSLTATDRTKILREIKRLVPAKHINVANLHQDYSDWLALVDDRSPSLTSVGSNTDFETGVRELLSTLGSSHTAFFHANGNDVPPPYAVNATLRATDTPAGKKWMFLDVIEDGVAVGLESDPAKSFGQQTQSRWFHPIGQVSVSAEFIAWIWQIWMEPLPVKSRSRSRTVQRRTDLRW